MENQDLSALAQQVLGRVFVQLEASGRHVHITAEQAKTVFGHDLTPARPLSQPGQYLAKERVAVSGPKGEFQNVAVLGPARKSAQVEISLTDGRALGITPPVRLSGSTQDSPGVKLVGNHGAVELTEGVICAQRHIHMTPTDAARLGIRDGETVKLKVYSRRPVVFEDVPVRVSKDFQTRAHLDFDEANACALSGGELGRILQ
jgi:propanediol utilization protein